MNKDARHPAARRSVIIIGRDSLQNKLLAALIDQRSGCISVVRSAATFMDVPYAASVLALLDIESVDKSQIGQQLRSISATYRSIAVINADEAADFDQIVTSPGVKGVFFRDTSEDNLMKGIEAIFSGDYWLPRKVLCRHLERTRTAQRSKDSSAIELTRKEIETLKLLASGNSTHHIAQKLNVSPHTVKTHIYNLFRKIRVSNRVQAAQWAMRNIDGVEPVGQ